MPYKSEKQRRYLHSQKPEVAKKYDAHNKTSAYAKALRSGNQTPMGNKKTSATGAVGGSGG